MEHQIETASENLLEEYAEQVGQRLQADPAGNSWRSVRGARVLGERRPDQGSLVISTTILVESGGILFASGLEIRCYDIFFSHIGESGQRYDLDKIPGCDEELRGPAIPGPS
ncbi:hypothetical protein [Streptosporangium sp. NPDC002721]|uniref:hypothetical protein n=1 Tax=Streptosporangium sp. NPDC002721 TaxID=3366188 RepID=UPI0036751698